MPKIILKHVKKLYPNMKEYAVKDFNLTINNKEFMVFVGASGCGKSTTLRMIAGLEKITGGDLIIDNKRMNDIRARDRGMAMVFQNYALYPHMNVYNNLAFGLKTKKLKKEEIKRRIYEAANILEIRDYLKRNPSELSGGQKQRVALGRAMVKHPKVFLMDEPLSNLDARLRATMRSEIIKLHRRLGTTTIYVTHDQVEAMTMADRITVMKNGEIQQVGLPKDIYEKPNNLFVANFIGSPPMNLIHAEVQNNGFIKIGDLKFKIMEDQFKKLKDQGYVGKTVILGERPEYFYASQNHNQNNVFQATVELSELLGSEMILHTKMGNQRIKVKVPGTNIFTGDVINLSFNLERMCFFDPNTTNRIDALSKTS
ncbi:MAG: sn-glycerol-3-phosphate ABC transporter ATP-binding protein UgpC [Sporolactobacillus sp.]|nr:sn-glycerol-3-phosphate ABC transporter ATP-binding protein UgpC [Sporolactobacillus sp.]